MFLKSGEMDDALDVNLPGVSTVELGDVTSTRDSGIQSRPIGDSAILRKGQGGELER